jgi:NAD dependent epimerase/dehydratase family enzyme
MAMIVTTGVKAVPRRLQELGYEFHQPRLEPALRDALGSG